MKTKEAINILNYAVEYYDMLYSSGDSKQDEGEKNKAWKALNHVAIELDRKEKAKVYTKRYIEWRKGR